MASAVRYAALLGLVLGVACSDSGPAGPHSTDGSQIIPFPTPLLLHLGASRRLGVTVLDSTGMRLDSVRLSFSSSNSFVATVDSTGLVTAGNHGTATITISSPTASADVDVTTSDSAALPFRLRMTPQTALLMQSALDSVNVVATVTDSDGAAIPKSKIVYLVRDSSVVSLAGGIATGRAQGSTWIVASLDSSLQDSTQVTVIQARTMLPGQGFGVGASALGVLYASGGLNRLLRIDPASHAVAATINLPGTLAGLVAFNNAGTRAYVADRLGHGISVIDATNDHVVDSIATLTGDSLVTALLVPDGDSLLAVLGANNVYVIRLSTGAIAQVLALSYTASGLASHGTSLYVSYLDGFYNNPAASVLSFSLPALQQQNAYFTNMFYAAGVVLTPNAQAMEVTSGNTIYNQAVNATSFSTVATVLLPNYAAAFSILHSPYSNLLVVSGGASAGTLTPSGTSKRLFSLGGTTHQMAALKDGEVAIANAGGWVDFIR